MAARTTGRRSTVKPGNRSTSQRGGKSKSGSSSGTSRSGVKGKSASPGRGKAHTTAKSKSASADRSKTTPGKGKSASIGRSKTQSGAKSRLASASRGKAQASPSRSKARALSDRQASPGRRRTDRGNQGQTTRDHEFIRRWAEERGGKPSVVEGTQILRFNFEEPGGDDDDRLKEISWEEFFQVFDDSDLSLIFSERTSKGQTSRFFKFVREE